jgi:predicted Zn-dependent protease
MLQSLARALILVRSFSLITLTALTVLAVGCSEMVSLDPRLQKAIGYGEQFGGALLNKPSFSDTDEVRMAQQNARNFEAKHQMWDDPLLEAYLTDLTQRLVGVSKPRPFPYQIRIVKDASINAFTFGGGLLYVHAGLLARMENEAQLAMVLAHEIAHVTERHVTNGIEASYGIQLLGQLAVVANRESGAVTLPPAALQKTYEYSLKAAVSGHGRSQESDADKVGMDYLVKAGFDPREAPRTFEQLQKEYGDQGAVENFFYGDHPTNKTRISRTTDWAQRYSQEMASGRLVVNSEEFLRRTRELVIATAVLDYENKRVKTAAALFEKAAAISSKDPVPHYYLGKLALESGTGAASAQQATGYLATAIKAKDTYAPAYRELGFAFYRLRDKPKAIQAFKLYLKLEPHARDAERVRRTIEELQGE